MLVQYRFNTVLERMISQYQLVNGEDKSIKLGIRYFASLERMLGISALSKDNSLKRLAYLSRN